MNKKEFKDYLTGKGIKVDEQRLDQEVDALGGTVPDDLAEALADELSKPKTSQLAKAGATGSNKLTKSSKRQIKKKQLEPPVDIQVPTAPINPQPSVLSGLIDPRVAIERHALAVRTVEQLQINTQLVNDVAVCQQAVDDDLICGLLQINAHKISEVLDITYDEIFDGEPADRLEVWEQYQQHCRDLLAQTQSFINDVLNKPAGVSRWKVGAS